MYVRMNLIKILYSSAVLHRQHSKMEKSDPATIDTVPSQYSASSAPVPEPAASPPQYQANTEDVVSLDFLKGVAGILKVIQMVFSLVSFICASVDWDFSAHGMVWVQFVSMTSFLMTAILYILHAFKIPPKFPGKIPFKFCELCYYMFFTLCYFICGIVCSVFGYIGSGVAAAAFFTFASMVVYGADIYFRYIAWRHSGEGPYFSSMRSGMGSSSAAEAGEPRY